MARGPEGPFRHDVGARPARAVRLEVAVRERPLPSQKTSTPPASAVTVPPGVMVTCTPPAVTVLVTV